MRRALDHGLPCGALPDLGCSWAVTDRPGRITRLLESGSKEELLEVVYQELRALADAQMRREHSGHTLQPTALVHEAFLRLFETETPAATWEKRRHFYASATDAMRRILIEHARRARAAKRGGGVERVTLGPEGAAVESDVEQAVQIAEALDSLEREDARAAEVARLRFLLGLGVEETARVLNTSVRTVHREWAFARARLAQLIGE